MTSGLAKGNDVQILRDLVISIVTDEIYEINKCYVELQSGAITQYMK